MRTIFFLVMRTGFEPVNAALRTQCVKPLHQRAIKNILIKRYLYFNIYFSF